MCIAIGISTSYFVHFFRIFFSSIHDSDYGIDNLLLGGGLGEVGEGLTALELGVLDDTCVEDVVSARLYFSIEGTEGNRNLPASASLEKLPVYST